MTGHAFPRMTYYRGATDKKGQYFGPYPSGWAVKQTIHILQKVFKLRTCADNVFSNRSRPCLQHQIGRCTAPCVGMVSAEQYGTDIAHAGRFLRGKEKDVVRELEATMHAHALTFAYEQAAVVRNQISALSQVMSTQSMDNQGDIDTDIIAVVQLGEYSLVNLAMVRGGRHLGDRPFRPSKTIKSATALDLPEVLEAFVSQHYDAGQIPALLLTNVVLDEETKATLEAMLSQRAGYAVRITHRTQLQRKSWIEQATNNAQRVLVQQISEQGTVTDRLRELTEVLGIPYESLNDIRIECFDVSHTAGEATQSSCVVFEQSNMQSKSYRRFNIAGITGGDDYAAMKQTLQRHYGKLAEAISEAERAIEKQGEVKLVEETMPRLPEVVLVDGGKGQVEMARQVFADLDLDTHVIVGVAKGEGRKVGLETLIFADGRAPLELPPDSPALMLIAMIRDEAHRFAITGMRAKRAKARVGSALDDIEGIGPKRRKALLTRFGGVRGVSNASVEDIAQVDGVSVDLAKRIYAAMHG